MTIVAELRARLERTLRDPGFYLGDGPISEGAWNAISVERWRHDCVLNEKAHCGDEGPASVSRRVYILTAAIRRAVVTREADQ